MHVAVLGAGVLGLSTALLAQQRGWTVSLYTDRLPLHTTSVKAGASFKPHAVGYTAHTRRLLEDSWTAFERVQAEAGTAAGVRKHVHWEASSAPRPRADYLSVMQQVRILERPEVPGGYAFGWRYVSFFIDMPVYLAWLMARFEQNTGRVVVVERPFTDLEQLAGLPAEIVFNCTGLGSRRLCHDQRLIPIKGQVVVVGPRPDMDWSINADGFYVYPRRIETLLGGTTERNIDTETVDNGALHLVIHGNRRILPGLELGDVRRTYAGLRPYREGGIRIEAEERNSRRIVHNYGHGGAGVTLSWGSARAALDCV